jgi:hypothetical protein
MADTIVNNYCRGVWVPAFAGTTTDNGCCYSTSAGSTVISGHSIFQRAALAS